MSKRKETPEKREQEEKELQEKERPGTVILRFEITGEWAALYFKDFYTAIEDIYNLGIVLMAAPEELPPSQRFRSDVFGYENSFPLYGVDISNAHLEAAIVLPQPQQGWAHAYDAGYLRSFVLSELLKIIAHGDLFYRERHYRLEVKQTKYGSPGFNDFIGFGAIVGHIKDLLLKIIEIRSTHAKRELEVRKLELENIRNFLQIAREHDLTPEQLMYYEHWMNERLEVFTELIRRDKLQSVRLLPNRKRRMKSKEKPS
jgi:hypothetical protein